KIGASCRSSARSLGLNRHIHTRTVTDIISPVGGNYEIQDLASTLIEGHPTHESQLLLAGYASIYQLSRVPRPSSAWAGILTFIRHRLDPSCGNTLSPCRGD